MIELLIVVAIIAILAAIAVPNFLKAQTRAKVSRTMADMRSAGVAMTAYAVDNNAYPDHPVFHNSNPGDLANYAQNLMVVGGGVLYPGSMLTTPVAYISSIPVDLFTTAMYEGAAFAGGGLGDARSDSFLSYILAMEQIGKISPGWQGFMHGELRPFIGDKPVKYTFESAGPDLTWWIEQSGPNLPIPVGGRNFNRYFYDPTNGTQSQGQLVYSNVGFLSPRE